MGCTRIHMHFVHTTHSRNFDAEREGEAKRAKNTRENVWQKECAEGLCAHGGEQGV